MSIALTTGPPWRAVLAFASPIFVGNVVQQAYQLVDAVVVGRALGVDALAAVGAAGSLLFLTLGFAWGLTAGLAIPTAHAFGAGDMSALRRSVAAGSVISAAMCLLLTVLGPLLAGLVLRLLRTPPELLPQATTFGVVSFIGASGLMAFNYLAAIIRAVGDSRTPLVFLALSCILNLGLDLAFVMGFEWGVGGAALATIISQVVSAGLCLAYASRRVLGFDTHRTDWRVARVDLVHHLRIGLPMGFQSSIIGIGVIAVQVRLNTLGADAVAAYTAASRVDGLAVALLMSLGIAVSMFVAQNRGAGRPDRIRDGVRQAGLMALAGGLVLGIVLVRFGALIVRLFLGSEADSVVRLASQFLHVNGSLYALLGILFVFRGALQGLGNTLVPSLTGLIELVMRVCAAIVLGAAFGFAGVVWGNPLAWAGAVVVLIPAWLRARRGVVLSEQAVEARQV